VIDLTFDTSKLTKEIHFPVIRGIVETKELSFFKRLWRFVSFNRKFEIVEDYLLWVEELQKFILIPAKFIYNGASVPKILGMLYSTTGVLFLGSCPHDFGYKFGGLLLVDPNTGETEFKLMDKDKHDDLFNYLCTLETGMSTATKLARNALSIVAWPAWKKYRKEQHKFSHFFIK
jgi:hypothetical protein